MLLQEAMCGILHTGQLQTIASPTSPTALDFKQSVGMHACYSHGLAQEEATCYSHGMVQGELTSIKVSINDEVEDEGVGTEDATWAVKGNQLQRAKLSIHRTAEYPYSDYPLSIVDSLSAVDLVALLKACGMQKDLRQGTQLHNAINERGLLKNNVFCRSALISMYAKCGALEKAQGIFDEVPIQNVVLWTALISAYVQHGYGKKALKLFEQMQKEGLSSNAITFSCILKACGQVGDLEKGEDVHSQIKRAHLLGKDIVMATALVDMYAKCGALEKAQDVFDNMPFRNVVSWNALITGYAQYDCGEEALQCFQRMQFEGITPNSVTLASILKACGSIGALEKGQEIHANIVRERLVEKDFVISTAVVDMYAKCGALEKAQEVFDRVLVQDIVIWNALISGYDQHGHGEEALSCFEEMQLGSCSPDPTTYTCILNACGSTRALDKGQEIHATIVREALVEEKVELANALVDMYVKCGVLGKAQEVFDELPVENVVSWNALLAGYVEHGLGKKAIECYEQMQLNGCPPNAITFACILKACGSIGVVQKGQEVHARITMERVLDEDVMVGTALVDMYAKCGAFESAVKVFEELPSRNVVSWNALITGYTQHGHSEEAIYCFEQMKRDGFLPDAVTFTCILKVCGSVGAVRMGQVLHVEVVRHGLSEMGGVVAVALLALYASCGLLEEAHYLFNRLPIRDVVSWGVLLGGYAQSGKDKVVFSLLDQMIGEGHEPNSVVLAVILNVCSHRGLIDEGLMYFETLSKEHGHIASLEHHTSLIDLFGRAGLLEEAVCLASKVSCNADLTMWHTLLSGCQKWGDMELGRWAFEHAEQMGENNAAVYISLSNMCASTGHVEKTHKVEALRRIAWGMPECSQWIYTGQTLHSLSIHDHRHPQSKVIYTEVECISEKLSKEVFPQIWVSQSICIDKENNVLCDHCDSAFV